MKNIIMLGAPGAGKGTQSALIAEEYGIPQAQGASVLHRFDHRRPNFYHANTGRSWREREGYHMVLDSGLLGVELCSQLLVAAAQSEG